MMTPMAAPPPELRSSSAEEPLQRRGISFGISGGLWPYSVFGQRGQRVASSEEDLEEDGSDNSSENSSRTPIRMAWTLPLSSSERGEAEEAAAQRSSITGNSAVVNSDDDDSEASDSGNNDTRSSVPNSGADADVDVEAGNTATNGNTDAAAQSPPTVSASVRPLAGDEILFHLRRQRVLDDIDDEDDQFYSNQRQPAQHPVVILLMFVLLARLWVQAIVTSDGGLTLLCVVLTVFVTSRRTQTSTGSVGVADLSSTMTTAEQFRNAHRNNVIAAFQPHADPLHQGESGENNTDATRDVQAMPFQMQMALAIMESRRIMAITARNGGMPPNFGDEDNHDPRRRRSRTGVSRRRRTAWDRFVYNTASSENTPDNTDSVTCSKDDPSTTTPLVESPALSEDDVVPDGKLGGSKTSPAEGNAEHDTEDGGQDALLSNSNAPCCSICLQEYDQGDSMIRLPCKHVYHDGCITAWVSNHVRCPLCNYDLEGEPSPTTSNDAAAAASSS